MISLPARDEQARIQADYDTLTARIGALDEDCAAARAALARAEADKGAAAESWARDPASKAYATAARRLSEARAGLEELEDKRGALATVLDTTGAALIEAERLAWLEGQRWWEAEAQRIAEPLRESILALMTARKGAGDSDPFAGVFRALDISGATPLPEPPAGAPSMYRRRLSVKGWQR